MRSTVVFDEVLPRPEPLPSEPEPLADRLRICSRLFALAADELMALERGDLTRRRELAELREELVNELQPPHEQDGEGCPPNETSDPAEPEGLLLPLPQQVARMLAEVLYQLEEREAAERRMQDRWSSLEQDALKAMHVGERISAQKAGRYPMESPTDARLDLRF